jgi:hypothetical protein
VLTFLSQFISLSLYLFFLYLFPFFIKYFISSLLEIKVLYLSWSSFFNHDFTLFLLLFHFLSFFSFSKTFLKNKVLKWIMVVSSLVQRHWIFYIYILTLYSKFVEKITLKNKKDYFGIHTNKNKRDQLEILTNQNKKRSF